MPLLSVERSEVGQLSECLVKCISALASNVANEFVEAATKSKRWAPELSSCDGDASVRIKLKSLVKMKQMPSLEATGERTVRLFVVLVTLPSSQKYCLLWEECSHTASFCSNVVFTPGDESLMFDTVNKVVGIAFAKRVGTDRASTSGAARA